MSQKQMRVLEVGCSLKFPKFKNSYQNAFSVAEAMIALLIGTIILGLSAPMISKQLKYNDFTSIQSQILNKKIENVDDKSDANAGKISQIIGAKTPSDYAVFINGLSNKIVKIEQTLGNSNIQNLINGKFEQKNYDSDIDELWDSMDEKASTSSLNNLNTTLTSKITTEINKLKEELKSKFIPSGAVMYFDLGSCPSGWTPLVSKYSSASGAFIRNMGEGGRKLGSYQGSAVPDIQLALRVDYGNQDSLYVNGRLSKYGTDDHGGALAAYSGGADEPMYNMSTAADNYKGGDLIKSDVYNKGVKEVRPNNIALLACRKN